ncbi:MAG: TldD/PmbA family protein [Proteobacteria bacterium]|nr:TldD/PmbA family protein [Pseudomonadota bacterium]NDD04765.1 TldD/PmbA family protein [Pseudomonadota bacterium]NDG27281.1 TldD/PmbA family protein [Pseudomonadota bacterium]
MLEVLTFVAELLSEESKANMDILHKERHLLENAASQLISEALRQGADSAEVCGSYGQRSKISLEKQDFHLASTDDGYQLGIRVLKGQQQGFASCNTLEAKELKEIAARAVEIAGFSPENPHFSIQSVSSGKTDHSLEMWDESLSRISLQTQKDWALWMSQEFLKDKRIRLNEGALEIGRGLYSVSNSKGTHQLESETNCNWTLMGMAAEEDNITSFDYFSQISRKSMGIGDKIVSSSRRFRDSLLRNLKTGPATSYKGLVLFSPRAVLDILIDSVVYHLNGRVVLEGSSRWKTNDLGTKVLSPLLFLEDSAWNSDRMSCGLFDREGTPTQDLALIKEGMLTAFLLDHYSAKGLHQSSNGHAVGGPSSAPTVGSHNLSLRGGTQALNTLMAQQTTPQGILWVNRYSGQTDPVTGDFSGVAKGSEWWVNGEFQHCVKETLVSGNVFEALGPCFLSLSQETQVVDSSGESPTALIDGISVTAN